MFCDFYITKAKTKTKTKQKKKTLRISWLCLMHLNLRNKNLNNESKCELLQMIDVVWGHWDILFMAIWLSI